MDRPDSPPSRLRTLRLALWILLLGTSTSALAAISIIKPGKAPRLDADEGLLVVALDTDVHIDRGFVQRVGARSELVVMKEAEPGRNLRLLKLPAGRYHWHSLRIAAVREARVRVRSAPWRDQLLWRDRVQAQ